MTATDPPPPTMRKFAGHRTPNELQAECLRRGWPYSDRLFNQGNDCVSFTWRIGRVSGDCVFNTFNGRFMGETKSGLWYSSSETTHEDKAWFRTLLSVCYKPLSKTRKEGK